MSVATRLHRFLTPKWQVDLISLFINYSTDVSKWICSRLAHVSSFLRRFRSTHRVHAAWLYRAARKSRSDRAYESTLLWTTRYLSSAQIPTDAVAAGRRIGRSKHASAIAALVTPVDKDSRQRYSDLKRIECTKRCTQDIFNCRITDD